MNTGSYIEKLRNEFPILNQQVNGYPLVYLDNAATTQKPGVVLQSIQEYYRGYNANIHRGAHFLAHKATEMYEAAREKTRDFLGAALSEEIIFTSGTTDAINLVAQSWGRAFLRQGDEILIPVSEHHSNIVPWQMVAEITGAVIRVIPINDRGEWNLDVASSLIGANTRLVAVNHVSNATGTINPVKWIAEKAHAVGAVVVVDGAQATGHLTVNVQDLGCDFYACSAHKMFGPTGTGVLYGKKAILDSMPPYRGGGEMIRRVSFEKTTYNDLPFKFEAGTPDIAGVIATGTAVDFIRSLDSAMVAEHEQELLAHTTRQLTKIPGLRVIGTSDQKVAVISFVVDGVHHYDIGTLLDKQGVAVRTGHHCTEPLWESLGLTGSVRASFSIYNTESDADRFVAALEKSLSLLRA